MDWTEYNSEARASFEAWCADTGKTLDYPQDQIEDAYTDPNFDWSPLDAAMGAIDHANAETLNTFIAEAISAKTKSDAQAARLDARAAGYTWDEIDEAEETARETA